MRHTMDAVHSIKTGRNLFLLGTGKCTSPWFLLFCFLRDIHIRYKTQCKSSGVYYNMAVDGWRCTRIHASHLSGMNTAGYYITQSQNNMNHA